jgi:flagellin-like hook-associated protein FlgL
MANDIKLTSAMRSNLLSLQSTQKLMDTTQERLSTGLKVNSAIDNPSSYFTAQGLNQRAGDLEGLLDSMGQGIQTIQAANEGIEAITTLVEQAKSLVTQYSETSDTVQQGKLDDQYKEIITQINDLAKDSSYKGINLLGGDDLTVYFNEEVRSTATKIEITGITIDATTATSTAGGLGMAADIATDADVAMDGVIGAINALRGFASDFSNAYSIVQNREEFTENLINVLTEGADKLTLADMNEESANMLALQTRQQLGINALSLSAQAQQSVLSLF